jgi:hypothetical protein
MYNYCTLFDSNYLTRGLAMYESLKKHSDSFHLYIFAFDDRSNELLRRLNLEFVTVVSLQEFEDESLLAIKDSRSAGEYCWTCTPSIIKYSIEQYGLDSCTYLDADLYFFANPAVLIEEMGEKSVLITEHGYTPEYDQSATSGIYCVQFMTFKNDTNGMNVLNWWRESCNAWCYARFEDGKFGDQKYLDDWTTRFDGVHVLQHLGGGVAPWNIQQYKLEEKPFELVFYHFHNFKFLNGGKIDLGIYKLKKSNLKFLYTPYVKHLFSIMKHLEVFGESYDYNGTSKRIWNWKTPMRKLYHWLMGRYNIYNLKYFLES